MKASKRDRPFAIDEARQIGSRRKTELVYEPVASHIPSTPESTKRNGHPKVAVNWWRRRDSRFRLFRGGLDYAFILCRMRSVLSACADPSARSAVSRSARL